MSITKLQIRLGMGMVAAGLLALLLMGVSNAVAQDTYRSGEVVVRLQKAADAPGIAATFVVEQQAQLGTRPLFKFSFADMRDAQTLATQIRQDSRVVYAEPVYFNFTPGSMKDSPWAVGSPEALKDSPWAVKDSPWAVGNSTAAFTEQWASAAIRLPEAHAISRGYGIRVAVLDTGIDATHPVFAGKLVPGYDFVGGDNDPNEEGSPLDHGFGHGTHVAGLVLWAAPQARIMPLRVLDKDGVGDIWSLAEAMLHAVDPDGNPATQDGAQILNLSLGISQPTSLVSNIKRLVECKLDYDDDDLNGPGLESQRADKARCDRDGGVTVFAAAGNNASEIPLYPAGEDGAIAVAATNSLKQLASFTNRGDWVRVGVPGQHMLGPVPGGGAAVWSGTSMATPVAAGIGALMKSYRPLIKSTDIASKMAGEGESMNNTSLKHLDAAKTLQAIK